MDLVKLCPACNEENPVSEVICRVCMTDLTSVSPVPAGSGKTQAVSEDAAPPEKSGKDAAEPDLPSGRTFHSPAVLTLRLPDGRSIPVASGGILGRNGDAPIFFQDFRTVSRRHAKVDLRGGTWQIEDLQSTNGTWVNGKRLMPGQTCPLKGGDAVALSLACEMRVIG
jgi:hypothetical protein